MMGCSEYRRSLLADPRAPSADMRAHLESCHDCTQYTERLLRFEGLLDRALRIDAAQIQDNRVIPLHSADARAARPLRVRRTGLAIAASVLLAVAVAGGLWLAAPGPSLAADVVTHMAGEPDAWQRTDVQVPEPRLNEVMGESHVHLRPDAEKVTYANSCLFRGHRVPHLVVQTASGPVTVMVLTHESLPKSVQFDEQGYRGVIVPVAHHGSLAVLARGSGTDTKTVEDVATRVLGSIEWTG